MLKFRATLAAICLSGWAAGAATVKPVNLRCEYRDQPVGIDAGVPRLSWQIQDARRDAMQTAYQIVVASTRAALAKHRGDVWDSGKITSDQCIGVEYKGPAVESRHRYYWQVRVWDQKGHPSTYSDASYWEMGLLQPSDWKAQWISGDARLLPPFVDWLWSPGENAREKTEKTPHYFRTAFELTKPDGGTLEATAKDSIKVWVNGRELTPVYPVRAWGTMKTFSLKDVLRPGKNVVAIEADTEGGPAAMAAFLWWNGPQVITGRPGTEWKVSTAAPSEWKSADFDDSSWSTAVPVAKLGEQPFGDPTPPIRASYLRKTFDTAKPIARARVYVTALGSYRLHINGQRVGKDILTPDWTDYRKRVQYQTYDVTGLLKQGRNAIGATLGEGWYGSALGWQLVRYNFGPPPPRLLAQLEIEYKDGTSETIVTDRSWKTAQSPILRSDLYAGEFYDATLETPGWDQPQYADSGWTPVRVQAAPAIAVSAQDS
ncbi:MAG TPA: alpha-L-rhamnosidase N-terminal domain-containing protein, partial [Bryobacteraceae bacterium]|nr:alpha-L-rhamnosidase N-terminal domain-containing protein [Bryobacteraceae bacterium]